MRRPCLKLAAAILSCASPAGAAPPADSIEYALADTRVKVNLDLVLEQCPGAAGEARLTPTLTLAAVSSAGPAFRIGGAELRSWLKKRDLTLTLHENGTLKSVGASTQDRTASVVGNVFKLATSLVTLGVLGLDAGNPTCRPEIVAATRGMARLKQALADQQEALAAASAPDRIKAIRDAIDGLAARIADLRTGPLRLALSATVAAPPAPGPVPVRWNDAAFEKWFGTWSPVVAGKLAMVAAFAAAGSPPPVLPVESDPPPRCRSGPCPAIAIREPVAGTVAVAPANPAWPGFGDATAKIPLAVGQWGGLSYFPLTAGLGQTRSMKLELDPFGRKTSLGLNSEARAEAITGGLVGITDAAAAFSTATSDVKQQQARIAELETRQKYNKLMRCEAIIEAGGFTCPD
jgi:hypothetical protein